MPDVLVAPRPAARKTIVPRQTRRVHPCIAHPDLYPVEGPRVVAGLVHDFALKLLWDFLKQHLEHTPHAPHYRMAGDVYLHAEGGGRRVAPDIILYLALRVPPSGQSFAVEYDGPPDLVLEQLSHGTWEKDVGVGNRQDDKKRFYAECGVREYWIYDPEGYRTDGGPILQGFRLHAKQYREIAPVPEDELWWSDVLQTYLGLALQQHSGVEPYAQLRVLDPKTGTWYGTEAQRIREQQQDKARQDALLAEKDAQLTEKDALLAEKDVQLTGKDAQLAEKDVQLTGKDAQLTEKDAQIAHLKRQLGLDDSDSASSTDDCAEA